jgi:hypothetical protein
MTDTTYNGWTNYATWRVNLEIFDGMEPRNFGDGADTTYELSQSLKYYAEELMYSSAPEGLARDYALTFLAEVDFYSIAHRLITDYAEQYANEETETN